MQKASQIAIMVLASSKKVLGTFILMLFLLLILFSNNAQAVNESGNLNIGNGQYASRNTDITWTSGSINLNGGTLEIFGNLTINSGVNFNFNNNSTLIVHGNFTYPVNFQLNSGLIRVHDNFILANRSIEINNGSKLEIGGSLTTASTITLNNGSINITGSCNTANLTVNNGTSIHVGGTLTSTGTILMYNGLIDVEGNLFANVVTLNNTSLFVVDGNFTKSGDLNVTNSNVDLVIAGNYNSTGGATTIQNNGDIFVFGSTTGCTGTGCPQIKNQTQWEALPNPPGENYVNAGELIYYSSGTFTVPAGVNALTVECWGGGGRGGSVSGGGVQQGGGGGGGGAYSRSVLRVTAGQTYTVEVGAASTTTSAGGDSYFRNISVILILAKGGNSAGNNSTTGATGGAASGGVGQFKFSGGNGANASGTSYGGGGGSSAGTGNNGTSATDNTGATAPDDGGDGGNGRNTTAGNGSPGLSPGGAGGGALKTASANNTSFDGGTGASGQVIITWTEPSPFLIVEPGNLDFGYTSSGSVSSSQSYSLSGFDLEPSSGTISITAPSGFKVSLYETSGFDGSIEIDYEDSEIDTTIWVRFEPDDEEEEGMDYSEIVSNAGGGASGDVNVFGTTIVSYCESRGNTNSNFGITRVTIGDIDHTSARTSGYSDFTTYSTDLLQGETYQLTVVVEMTSNATIHGMAWFDWNKDGDFTDLGEAFRLGSANRNGNATGNSRTLGPINIEVPESASTGTIGMRISIKQNDAPTSCETGFDGEVEDYRIHVIGTEPCITTQPRDTTICEGEEASFTVIAPDATSFQWYYLNVDDWVEITGSLDEHPTYIGYDEAALNLSGITAAHDGFQYRCIVNGACSNEESDAATLTVLPTPVVNISPGVVVPKCPDLDEDLNFNANSEYYDAGASVVIFKVTRSGSYVANWSFLYSLSITNSVLDVRFSAEHALNPSSPVSIDSSIDEIEFTFYIVNEPGDPVSVEMTISDIEVGICSGASGTHSYPIEISPMPAIGEFK